MLKFHTYTHTYTHTFARVFATSARIPASWHVHPRQAWTIHSHTFMSTIPCTVCRPPKQAEVFVLGYGIGARDENGRWRSGMSRHTGWLGE